MRANYALAASLAIGLVPLAAYGDVTGITGSNQPQPTIQPSIGVNYIVRTTETSNALGDIDLFGGNFAPAGWMFADGSTLPKSQHPNLFNLLGTTYGGDGVTTFRLPDLRGRVPIGQGTGPGFPFYEIGVPVGSEAVTLTSGNLPSHSHPISASNPTGVTGSNSPDAYSNMQPSLPLNYMIALQGIFPSTDGAGPSDIDQIYAQVTLSARSTARNGWALAQGQLLPINQNQALFSLLGFNFGGNGQTTFALPDFRGRSAVEPGQRPGLTSQFVGEFVGTPSLTLTDSRLPSHVHSLPGGGSTGVDGGGLPETNMQPSLALHYLIALQGIFPNRDAGDSTDDVFFGQIKLFAGTFAPKGWAFCDGQLLPINQNQALFSLLGFTWGGNGTTTFALPDLRDLLDVDMGQGPGLLLWNEGQFIGTETNTLTIAQMPAHDHALVPVPEPASLGLLAAGALVLLTRRKEVSTV